VGGPHRILYVEDNDANFALVRKVLQSAAGFEVEQASTGEAALAMVAAQLPGLILLDLDLPGMSGIEVARQLKSDSRTAQLPIIAITASVMKHERTQALEAGCLAFVEKPFDIRRLRALVLAAVEGRPLDDDSLGG
jgi:two-component system cell cycle response regulator DivK